MKRKRKIVMLMHVLKNCCSQNPDEIEMNTLFHIGQELTVKYYWRDGYKWSYELGSFTVKDISYNMLINPCEVTILLTSEDEVFYKRCNVTEFYVPESALLERIKAAKEYLVKIAQEKELSAKNENNSFPNNAILQQNISWDEKSDLIFEYEGFHFNPVEKLNGKQSSFKNISHRIYSERELAMSSYDFNWVKNPWNYNSFYLESTIKDFDIFLCQETGKLYIPGQNELFGWM